MTSSNGNIFRVTGHLCGEFTCPRWIPHTKASGAELWCCFWLVAAATNHIRRDWCGGLQYTLLHSHRLLVVGGSVADNAYWTLLAIVCHHIFIIILDEYRLGLLGIEMYHGFKRRVNPTDTSFAHLKRYAHAWCMGCAWWLQNCLSLKDASGGMAYLTQMSLLKKSKYCI